MNVFQERLLQVIEEKKVKPTTVANDLGISKATLSKYLSDSNKEPMLSFMLKLAEYFDVSAEWLYGAVTERRPFKEPKLVEIYEKLSELGKKEVFAFAEFILSKEGK